jgi:hypothetical protein
VVVALGVTLTAVPLVAARLPGVITPGPPANIPVRLALAPAVIAVGLTTKLVMVAGAVVSPLPDGFEHPVMPTKPRLRVMPHVVWTRSRFILFLPAMQYNADRSSHDTDFSSETMD